MSEQKTDTILMETNDIEKARRIRSALGKKFYGKRFWVCVFNRGKKNGKPRYKVTVSNLWDGKLSSDELKPVTEFVKTFEPDKPKDESVQ